MVMATVSGAVGVVTSPGPSHLTLGGPGRLAVCGRSVLVVPEGESPHPRRPYRDRIVACDLPNTIDATNPMPTNSTTSATESYSSQCRLPESMTFHPCFKGRACSPRSWTKTRDRVAPYLVRRASAAV